MSAGFGVKAGMNDGAVRLAGPFADIQFSFDQERVDFVTGEFIEDSATDHTATNDERTNSRPWNHHEPFRRSDDLGLQGETQSYVWAIV